MNYQVVFDALQKGYDWWVFIVPLVLGLILATAWKARRYLRLPGMLEGFRTIVLVVIMVLASCLVICGFLGSFANYLNAQAVLREGKTQVVEGIVQDFKPQPQGDKGLESFTVNGIKFEYSVATITPGFNNASTHGGPINRNGIQVRIHYTKDPSTNRNMILKLEIAR